MPKVMLTSVVGTTFMYSIPIDAPSSGIQSTGIRSMKFIRNTQTKMVRASGAIRLLFPWKVSLTLPSTKSTTISTNACSLPGVPADAFLAALPNTHANISPRKTDQNIESTLIAIGLPAHWFHTHSPASFLHTWRFCR